MSERPAAPPRPAPLPRRGATPRRPIGLRREVAVLLPTCLILLVALSTYTLFSYRAAVERLVEERRAEALRTARGLAADLAALPVPPDAAALARLRRRAPAAGGLAWVDVEGTVRAADGELAALADPPSASAARVIGPDGESSPAIVAFAPLAGSEPPGLLRLDVPSPILAAQVASLRILTIVLLVVDVGIVLLFLLFLRHLMAPYDALLAHARQIGEGGLGGEEDEIELLVRTFERGMTALAAAGGEGGEGGDGDLATLQRALGGSLESGLILLDREGRVLALNPLGTEILGIAAPPPGAPLAAVLERHPDLLGLLAAAVAGGEGLQRREVELAAPGRRTVGLTLHPLRRPGLESGTSRGAAGGDLRGFLVLFTDLTEVRRRAEESRLADSLVRLGEMAAGIAHELRNSLATLRGYMTLLERTPEEREGHLAEMRREADHVQRVLDDFLLFAHPGSLRLEPLRLGTLLARAAADPVLSGVKIELPRGRIDDDSLLGDAQLLERALRNLLHNAAQAASAAAPPDAEAVVEVGARRDGEAIEVTIDDRGPGLPPELRDDVFLPFVTTRRGGVGLGLSLAHRIVALHGGTVALEDRPGGGARARVRLPDGKIDTERNDGPVDPLP